MLTATILATAFVVASTLAYRAVHAWRAPMPAPRALKTYRPAPLPAPAPKPVPHLDVDAVPGYSPKWAIIQANRNAPEILSRRERMAAEERAIAQLLTPFNTALNKGLEVFHAGMRAPMATVQRWLDEADATAELNLWRANTPTGEFPIVTV
jgi:hypothetical protein